MIQAAGYILYRREGTIFRFLLLRSAAHGTWGFPKGKLEPGEDLEQGARRELTEETGISWGDIRVVPGFRRTVRYRLPAGQRKSVTNFLAEAPPAGVRISDEHSVYRWAGVLEAWQIFHQRLSRATLLSAHRRLVGGGWGGAGDAGLEVSRVGIGTRMGSPFGSPAVLEPSLADARTLYREWFADPPLWLKHSLVTSRTAEVLARHLAAKGLAVDPESAGRQGLFHDLGRSHDHGCFHGLEGYRMARALGWPRLGRAALSHWLKNRTREESAEDSRGEHRLPPRFWEQVYRDYPVTWTGEDELVSCADSLTLHDQAVTLDDRIRDALERYGSTPWIRRNIQAVRAHEKKYVNLLGFPLVRIVEELRKTPP